MVFKEFSRGVSEFFSGKKVILLLVFLVVAFVLLFFIGGSANSTSMMQQLPMGRPEGMTDYTDPSALEPSSLSANNNIMIPSVGVPDGAAPVQGGSGYTALETANPAELLPNDVNNAWSQLNPAAQGDIRNPDLLQAGYLIGLDTIGQTLRIPNYQLRADPIIPKQNIGPWNQAPDVDPDYGRVPLDAGCSK
jgi:hypothetical protein